MNWLSKLIRKKVKLTYWLGDVPYTTEICDFKEKEPNCIIFKDYYTKKSVVVKYRDPITYVLEQIK